jgi:hypothetical protein
MMILRKLMKRMFLMCPVLLGAGGLFRPFFLRQNFLTVTVQVSRHQVSTPEGHGLHSSQG